jgi:hypothetical protein
VDMDIDYGDADCYYVSALTAAAINFPVVSHDIVETLCDVFPSGVQVQYV